MKSRRGSQARTCVQGAMLALLLHPFAPAQEPFASKVEPQRAASEAHFAQRPHGAAQSGAQASDAGVPDSPGTVQARLNTPSLNGLAMAIVPQSPDPQSTSATPSVPAEPREPAKDSSSESSPASSNAVVPVPDMPSAMDPASSMGGDLASEPPARQQTSHEPLGTALAEPLQTTGVAASRPAGAAVAPAKQRRVRTILIRVGSLVGAGVAIGTTMALSQGSPSRPPGSH